MENTYEPQPFSGVPLHPAPMGLPPLFEKGGLVQDNVVADCSGSMEDDGFEPGRSKLDLMLQALMQFINAKCEYRPQDWVSMWRFDHVARQCCPALNICDGYSDIAAAIEELARPPHGGTKMGRALLDIREYLNRFGFLSENSPYKCRVLAYTDGADGSPNEALQVAAELKSSGVLIETIGIGPDRSRVDEPFLRRVATTDEHGCHYRFLGDAQSIRMTFEQVATGMLVYER